MNTASILWADSQDHLYLIADIARVCIKDRRSHAENCDTYRAFVGESKKFGSFIAFMGRRAVGFIAYEIDKDQIEIFEMAVLPEYRRRGIGTELLNAVVSRLGFLDKTALSAVARESSLDYQMFLKVHFFFSKEIKRDYFSDEDGYVFLYTHSPVPHRNRIADLLKEK